jgi:hypothetical protein
VQKVRGLLQGVGAVGDHHAGHLGPRQVKRGAPRESLPDGELHVLAVELRQLLGL